MALQMEPETLSLAHGGELADGVLLEEGGVHVGDAHQRLLARRLVLLNCLLEGSKGGGVILTGGDEPAICSSLDQIQIIGNGNLMVDDGRLS